MCRCYHSELPRTVWATLLDVGRLAVTFVIVVSQLNVSKVITYDFNLYEVSPIALSILINIVVLLADV